MIKMSLRNVFSSETEQLIRPQFIEKALGDGKQWLKVRPVHSNLNFFVIRIDSSMDHDSEYFENELFKRKGIFETIKSEVGEFGIGCYSWGYFHRECVDCGTRLNSNYQHEVIRCIECDILYNKLLLDIIKTNTTYFLKTEAKEMVYQLEFDRLKKFIKKLHKKFCELFKSCTCCPISKISGYWKCKNTPLMNIDIHLNFLSVLKQGKNDLTKHTKTLHKLIDKQIEFIDSIGREFDLWIT